jgi:hypothetical protein
MMCIERHIAVLGVASIFVSCGGKPPDTQPAHAKGDATEHRLNILHPTNFSTEWYSVMTEILASNLVSRESFVSAVAESEEAADLLYFPLAAMLRCDFEAADLNSDSIQEIFVHVLCPPVPGVTGNHPIYVLQKVNHNWAIIGDFWGRDINLGSLDSGYARIKSSTRCNLSHYSEGTYAYKDGRYRLLAVEEWSPQPAEP